MLHEHKLKTLYYRKLNPKTKIQDFIKVDGKFICEICKEIIEEK